MYDKTAIVHFNMFHEALTGLTATIVLQYNCYMSGMLNLIGAVA